MLNYCQQNIMEGHIIYNFNVCVGILLKEHGQTFLIKENIFIVVRNVDQN